MKTTYLVIIAYMMLNVVLFAAEQKPSRPDVVEKLGLKEAVVEGATIYYEPCLEEKLDILKKAYSDYRKSISDDSEPKPITPDEFASKKTVIIDDIYNIVGGDDEELKEKLLEVANGFIDLGGTIPLPLLGSDNVIYLMLQSTTKEYLKSGGTLPNLTYDKEAGTVEYKLLFGKDTDNSSNQELLLPVPPTDEAEKLFNTIFTEMPKQFDGSFGRNGFVVVHEIAEVAILGRLRSNDPYRRWFSEGFANAITYEILKRHFSKGDADAFLEDYSAEPYQGIKARSNLQYWFVAELSMPNHSPVKPEDELTYARYCFATEQARRIVDTYGIESIKKIIDQYIAAGNKKPGQLLPAIKEATGDEIEKHLMAYQSFQNKEEGLKSYLDEVTAATTAKDYPSAAFAILRILELRGDQPFSEMSLNTRMSLAQILHIDGHDQEATQWITEFADVMCESKNSQNQYAGRALVIMYAIQIKRPQVALEYARAILQTKPEDAHALMIVMLEEVNQKNTKKAVEIAKKICEIEPDDKDPCHAVAKSVLENLDK